MSSLEEFRKACADAYAEMRNPLVPFEDRVSCRDEIGEAVRGALSEWSAEEILILMLAVDEALSSRIADGRCEPGMVCLHKYGNLMRMHAKWADGRLSASGRLPASEMSALMDRIFGGSSLN
jgi:hypothetical protein